MHSCWCILLIECGLNSNFHLNSNLFELGIEKEIEKETNPNPIPEAHQLNPVQPRPTPSHFFFPEAQSHASPRPARLSSSPGPDVPGPISRVSPRNAFSHSAADSSGPRGRTVPFPRLPRAGMPCSAPPVRRLRRGPPQSRSPTCQLPSTPDLLEAVPRSGITVSSATPRSRSNQPPQSSPGSRAGTHAQIPGQVL